ncbi:MAG TPA: aminotransferase class I/II-fold pyridoxal phosphate-dependent enzyme [Gemmatimonadales bacterium]|jgi:aromatic-L-amino-acid decarboxylase
MEPEEFRRHAHALADWMADYLRDVGTLPITPAIAPGDIRRQLPPAPPSVAEPFERLFADFQRIVVPGMTHWNHPGWMAYFPGNTSPPSILGEMLTAVMGAQCMSWATSPAATELEQVVMDWLRQMLGLPDSFTGVIQDTASTATLVALLTARERATKHAAGQRGLADTGAGLTVYASTEAHSSVDKAVKLSGYGLDHYRRIATDAAFALRADELDRAIASDRAAGLVPACVVASVGTTSSTAVDPVPAIAEICARHGVWLHVDAAYAGTAALVPELRASFAGVERADSVVVNPHKWMLTNFDCTAYFVRDTDALLRTFQATPEYLRTAHDPEVVNYRDWGIQLGRRFRALKLWFVIRTYGVEGLRAVVRNHVSLARQLVDWITERDDFELMAPVPFGLVCFRYRPAGKPEEEIEVLNQRVLERVNAGRRFHLTHTRLGGRYTIRLVIGQRTTSRDHVAAVWREIQDAAARA